MHTLYPVNHLIKTTLESTLGLHLFIQIATSVVEKSQNLSVAFHLSATATWDVELGLKVKVGVLGSR